MNLNLKLHVVFKRVAQGTQKLRSLKSLNIQNSPHRYRSFSLDPATIKKWLPCQNLGSKTVRNFQIDQQTTDIWSES